MPVIHRFKLTWCIEGFKTDPPHLTFTLAPIVMFGLTANLCYLLGGMNWVFRLFNWIF